MDSSRSSTPDDVLKRLHDAMNQHDLDAFLACFAEAYQSEQPIHPDRAFGGREQVEKNWSTIFRSLPDFEAELLSSAAGDDSVWAEWHWSGTQVEGGRSHWRGVTLFGVQDDQIIWGRLYMEPVQTAGAGIDAAVRSMTHQTPQDE